MVTLQEIDAHAEIFEDRIHFLFAKARALTRSGLYTKEAKAFFRNLKILKTQKSLKNSATVSKSADGLSIAFAISRNTFIAIYQNVHKMSHGLTCQTKD